MPGNLSRDTKTTRELRWCSSSVGMVFGMQRRETRLEALFSQTTPAVASDLAGAKVENATTLAERLRAGANAGALSRSSSSSALPHFQRWPMLPVTNRAMRGSLESVVSLQDILDRYQQRERSH